MSSVARQNAHALTATMAGIDGPRGGGYEGNLKGFFRVILLCWIECVFVGVASMSPKCWPRKGNELK